MTGAGEPIHGSRGPRQVGTLGGMNATFEDGPGGTTATNGIERLLIRVAEALHESGAPSDRIEASVAAMLPPPRTAL